MNFGYMTRRTGLIPRRDICQGGPGGLVIGLAAKTNPPVTEVSMKKTIFAVVLSLLCLQSSPLMAGDPAAGKAKAATCAGCHGPEGISPNDLWPNLAGQKEGYLIAQIKAFRDGQRTNPMMAPMVAPLSDTDIEDLAAYYASLGQ